MFITESKAGLKRRNCALISSKCVTLSDRKRNSICKNYFFSMIATIFISSFFPLEAIEAKVMTVLCS